MLTVTNPVEIDQQEVSSLMKTIRGLSVGSIIKIVLLIVVLVVLVKLLRRRIPFLLITHHQLLLIVLHILLEFIRIIRVALSQRFGNILPLLRIPPGVQPDMRVILSQQYDSLRAVNDVSRIFPGKAGCHKILQPGPGQDHRIRPLDLFHLIRGDGIVVKAGDLILYQCLHLQVRHSVHYFFRQLIDGMGRGQQQRIALGLSIFLCASTACQHGQHHCCCH